MMSHSLETCCYFLFALFASLIALPAHAEVPIETAIVLTSDNNSEITVTQNGDDILFYQVEILAHNSASELQQSTEQPSEPGNVILQSYNSRIFSRWLVGNWQWLLAAFTGLFIASMLALIVHLNRRYQRRTRDLQLSEANYRTLVEYADVIHWKYDIRQDKFTYVSPQIKTILGYEPDVWTNLKSWADQIHPDDREGAVEYCFVRTAEGENHSFEYRCFASDNTLVWIRDTVSVKTEYSEPLELIGFMDDISALKRRSLAKEKNREERAQNRKMQALGQLTGGIAHDFNNILAIILGHCELINTSGDQKLLNQVKIIKSATERGRELVKNMLTYSRNQAEKPELISSGPVIREQLQLLRATIPSSIEFNVSIDDDLPTIHAEKLHIQQIIMNLAINARDAMDGKGNLSISATLSEFNGAECSCSACLSPIHGQWVDICITDTGTGIKNENTSILFEPFYSTKPTGKGSGMGLAVVTGILKQTGGHIRVMPNTNEKTGTEFHVLFPVASSMKKQTPPEQPETAVESRGNGEKILIVDDEPELGTVLCELLNAVGYNARSESNSSRVLDNMDMINLDYQLLITDQTMPEVSGLELISQLRARQYDIPVILCSGYSDAIDQNSAVDLGISYLEKPVDSQRLFGLVAEMLHESANQESNAAAC